MKTQILKIKLQEQGKQGIAATKTKEAGLLTSNADPMLIPTLPEEAGGSASYEVQSINLRYTNERYELIDDIKRIIPLHTGDCISVNGQKYLVSFDEENSKPDDGLDDKANKIFAVSSASSITSSHAPSLFPTLLSSHSQLCQTQFTKLNFESLPLPSVVDKFPRDEILHKTSFTQNNEASDLKTPKFKRFLQQLGLIEYLK